MQSKGTTVITDEGLRKRMEGEVRYLRVLYFDLLRYFGKLPIIDRVVSNNEASEIQRSPVSAVYDFIIQDLEAAINALPAPSGYATADKGRANKFSAKMLLGLVYMTRSGPNLGIEGPGLNSQEWEKAAAQFNDIIQSNEFAFLDSYASIFNYDNERNKEVIFNIEYSSGSNPVVGSTFPWVLVPDTWFQSKGFGTQGGLMIRPVAEDLLAKYSDTDVRKTFSIESGYTYGNVVETRSFVKKFVDITKVPKPAVWTGRSITSYSAIRMCCCSKQNVF